jgi:hypothetical protein
MLERRHRPKKYEGSKDEAPLSDKKLPEGINDLLEKADDMLEDNEQKKERSGCGCW